MYCDRCGTKLEEGASFCRACGKPVSEAPVIPAARASISGHLKLLGILWIALSAFRLLPGLALLAMGPHLPVPYFVQTLLPVIGIAFGVVALLGFAAGWGLLERQPWARMLALVLGFLSLVDVPLGTALGVYTLWVLLPERAEEAFRRA
jgi:hypothetical protein